jgi:hypothetical protein
MDNLTDSIGKTVDTTADVMNTVSDTANDWTGNHHKTDEYQSKYNSNKKRFLALAKGKLQTLSDADLKARAKALQREMNNWNWDEALIMSKFFNGEKAVAIAENLDPTNLNNEFVQKYIIGAGDYYKLIAYFGLDSDDRNLIDKITQYMQPEFYFFGKLPNICRGSKKNKYSQWLWKYKKEENVPVQKLKASKINFFKIVS